MYRPGLLLAALSFPLLAAVPPDCSSGARTFLPCELTFEAGTSSGSPYASDLLHVEFRSPEHKTYLMHSFSDGGPLRVRFSPTEPGQWTYRVSSEIARYNDKEATFTVADSGLPGMIGVANLRHWWTTKKLPHLWLSVSVPLLSGSIADLNSWLDARKHDGFTHIRGVLLSNSVSQKPLDSNSRPNAAYFSALDERILAAAERGFTLDLILADSSFMHFEDPDNLVRYLCARYAGLNVTWQGIEHFEDVPNSRALLKNLNILIEKYDGFDHPRSTDARNSGFPLVNDGWMNYLVEASADPQLGAVEHQFTAKPEVHIVQATDPEAFRRELWNATTNGEYPSVSYESLRNEANLRAVQAWTRILSGTRHWEFEPYFDVDGARAVGLNEVEYLAYADKPGIIEITLPRHKYNPLWVNAATGQELDLKDYKGEVFSQPTPDNSSDWILQVPRDGEKEKMRKYVYFESEDAPVQEPETDTAHVPFEISAPKGNQVSSRAGIPFSVKVTRSNRASRHMQYAWWGEVVVSGQGPRLLGLGSHGSFAIPPEFLSVPGAALHVRVLAINALGKAYELNHVYQLAP
jgi:hypothetical protein